MRLKERVFLGVAVALAIAWIVVAVRVAPALAPSRAAPTPTPLGTAIESTRLRGTLAFAQRGDILVLREGTLRPVASGGGRREPALSADGTRVAYSLAGTIDGKRVVDGQIVPAHLAYASIAARALTGGAELVLVDGLQRRDPGGAHAVEFEMQPAWSPDGAQLAFISDDGDGADLQVLTIATKRVATISRGSVLADPAWSPDAGTIAATTYTAGQPGILLVQTEGRAPSRRLELGREVAAYRPAYSPDARWLLVTIRTERGNDLAAVELRSSRLVELTRDGRSWGGVFSPDGGQIAFLREWEGAIEVYVMDLGEALRGGAPGPAQRVSRGGADGTSRPSWSR